MKTFLHYTKERELDEGVFGALGGALGTATRGLAKVGDFAAGFRDTVAPAFAQGAKPGSTLTGITAAAQAIRGRAERKREDQSQLDNEVVDAHDLVLDLTRKLAKAKTSEDQAYYQAKLAAAKDRLKAIAKAKKPEDLTTHSRQVSATRAANVRSLIP